MHLCFVPLTEDGRLSAKDIVGSKKKLTRWQDTAKNAALESKLEAAENAGKEKIANRLKYAGMEQELRELHALADSIPKEIFEVYQSQKHAASLHEPGKNGQKYE